MKEFVSPAKEPMLFEVFTDMEKDANIVKNVLGSIKANRSGKAMLKQTVKKMIGR